MADEDDTTERTEDPTQKRLDDAHDRGDVAKSQEVNTWFMISGATLVLFPDRSAGLKFRCAI
jgi:flagellar biosynthesis protein FlhB